MIAGIQLFTVAAVAGILGRSTRGIRKAIGPSRPTGRVCVRGKVTAGWSYAQLPAPIRTQLDGLRERRGIRAVEDLLVEAQESPAPVSGRYKERAEKRRLAMAELLLNREKYSPQEFQERGQLEYKRQFGCDLAPKTFQDLVDLVVRRDAGRHNWFRLDLYVEEEAFAPGTAEPSHVHASLDSVVAEFIAYRDPLPDQKRALIQGLFLHFKVLTEGKPRSHVKVLKRSFLDYVHASVGLCRNRKSLARWFRDRYRYWLKHNCALEAAGDGRNNNCGRPGYSCPDCEQLIRGVAKNLRGERGKKGNVNLAIQILLQKKSFCPKCSERRQTHKPTPAERLRMTPNAIEVASTKGAEAVRDASPTLHCDRSDIQAGDYFVIDDMTTNEQAWDEVDGKPISGQVQLLYTEDEASRYPLPFLMYFGPPNSRTIKKTLWQVYSKIGLPRKAQVTERGVFDNRTVAGDRRGRDELGLLRLKAGLGEHIGFEAMSAEELEKLRQNELGLQDPTLGLRIIQAHSPQAKTVERTFFEHQKRASILPGFSGFNQRNEKPKALVDFDRRVASGLEHPGNEYLRLSDLAKNYQQICDEFAHRGINGAVHRGRSPLDMWNEGVVKGRPLRRLPEEIEALFATRRLVQKIQAKGIRVKQDRFTDYFYYNEHTGRLVGTKVSVFINYDIPEFVHIEDPQTGTMLKVNRSLVPSRTATKEELAEVNHARKAHINGALAQSGNVDNVVSSWVTRDNDYPAADKEKGRAIINDTTNHRAKISTVEQKRRRITFIAEQLGRQAPKEWVGDIDAQLEGWEDEFSDHKSERQASL
jgi:hypothetical protein